MLKRCVRWVLVLVVIGFFAGVLAGCRASEPTPGVIRIGAVASLTGPAGEQGKNWVEGAELAVAELRAEGIAVELIVENDETSAPKVAAAFQKLARIDRVGAIIGGTWDYLAETAYPLAERLQVPFVTPSNPVEVLSAEAQHNRWVFSNGLSLRAARRAVADFLRAEGVRSVGLIYPALPFGTVQAAMVTEIAAELGIPVTTRVEFVYDSGYLDSVRLAALKVIEGGPDLVFCVFDASGVDLFLRELEKLRGTSRILTTQHLDQAFLLAGEGGRGRYTGAFGIYPRLEDGAFVARYTARFGRIPKVYAAQGYDALRFLATALHSRIDIADPSAAFTYRGVTGEHRLPPNGRALVDDRAVVMTTRRGVFEEYAPERR